MAQGFRIVTLDMDDETKPIEPELIHTTSVNGLLF